ncbi:MAG: YdcF family protein [Pirellulaceae bacterium]|nr:YdcF family protein [Pirellulaceae bacterium]
MYQLAGMLLNPFLSLHLLTVAALVLAWWRWPQARRGLAWVALPFAALTAAAWPPLAYLGLGSLEWAFPPSRQRPADVQAIVVLSGGLRTPDSGYPYTDLGDDTLRRCLLAAELYRAGPPCPILVSGGKVEASRPGPTLAAAMREFLLLQGVPDAQILVEDRSRNTYENAVESARVLRERNLRQVILVTDATHLWRAVSCFRKQQMDVLPRGADYQATDFQWSLSSLVPSEGAARGMRRVVHEWVGMGWYWLQDRV